ncbi:MAG: acetyl-CoA carboxylase biotin carboxylase subunit, partial [Proteobacteria bacterium]|nr:acetyl-CoA carboxylase biotin carboxylase subunit [Pseudomonadota bacterium]
ITMAATREAARERMIRALKSYVILGIRTTIPFLIDALRSPEFAKGNTYTDFIDRNFKNWSHSKEDEDLAKIAYVVEEMASHGRPSAKVNDRSWQTPWETLGEWRM